MPSVNQLWIVNLKQERHLKQTKKIIPPNYSNDNFYRDLGLIDKLPEAKNPLVEVGRKLRKRIDGFSITKGAKPFKEEKDDHEF